MEGCHANLNLILQELLHKLVYHANISIKGVVSVKPSFKCEAIPPYQNQCPLIHEKVIAPRTVG